MSSRRTMYCEKKKEKKWWGYIRNILADYPNGSKNEIDAVAGQNGKITKRFAFCHVWW